MTRAMLCAARLDFAGAFYYHPLFFILPAAVLAYILRRHIPRKLLDYSAAAACVIVIAVYVVRLLDPACDIVTFQPQDGLMYRVFHR
ncbi:MAG: DUF2752 domain-containing protein [Lachnospiraceae bacterium]|nr:DUF2752 domain-containing protein [Lachnospiraceae bacterium]